MSLGDHSGDWVTTSEVEKRNILDKVREGDDIAITNFGSPDWIMGTVTEVGIYKGRETRWQERRMITVCPHDGSYPRAFYEHLVEEVCWKE